MAGVLRERVLAAMLRYADSLVLYGGAALYIFTRNDGMKTIALVAENGAGKGLFVEMMKRLLPKYRIVSVRFSDVLCDILDMLGKERSRDNIDSLVTALRSAFNDEGILNDVMRKRLADTEADIVILDGLRKEKEISVVRERQGLLVYIAADQRVRYERRRQVAEKSDELNMSWEQFLAQANAAPQIQIRHIGETMADVTIENNESVEEFEGAIRKFIERNGFGNT